MLIANFAKYIKYKLLPDSSLIKKLKINNIFYCHNFLFLALFFLFSQTFIINKAYSASNEAHLDLPLCSLFLSSETKIPYELSTQDPPANCIRKCTADVGDNHAQNCIQFCDSMPAGTSALPNSNCAQRKCHQLLASEEPKPVPNAVNNCTIKNCIDLTKEELRDNLTPAEFGDITKNKYLMESKKYCEGSTHKCYEFDKEKLPYLKSRQQNTMCLMHDCSPATLLTIPCESGDNDCKNRRENSASCASGADEDIIEGKGVDFKESYIDIIDQGYKTMDTVSVGKYSRCNYRTDCSQSNSMTYVIRDCDGSESPKTTKHSFCTTECSDNECSGQIDCDEHQYEDECQVDYESPIESTVNIAVSDEAEQPKYDSYSWLFRPSINRAGRNRLPPNSEHITKKEGGKACYSTDNMRNNGWGKDVVIPRICIPLIGCTPEINLGYFYESWLSIITPKHCSAEKMGTRGTGYGYLCGTHGNIHDNIPRSDFAYIEGPASASYEEVDDGPHYSIRACLRYKNTGRLDACGERSCGLICAFGSCTQYCGYDRCRTLKVYQKDFKTKKDCSAASMEGDSKTCVSKMGSNGTVDGDLRLRAVKYGKRMVCVFLDQNKAYAYSQRFMNNEAKGLYKDKLRNYIIEDYKAENNKNRKFCASGTYKINDDGVESCKGGKNSNDDKSSINTWRAVARISYIDDNMDGRSDNEGYTDFEGRIFTKQQCAYIPLRRGPNPFHAIANEQNSPNLFIPVVKISKIFNIKGKTVESEDGRTDFHEPHVEVRFGRTDSIRGSVASTTNLSLDEWVINEEAKRYDDSDSDSKEQMNYNDGEGREYYTSVFIEKTYDAFSDEPLLCLYRSYLNDEGATKSKKIECVKRNKPEINKIIDGKNRKAVIIEAPLVTKPDGQIVQPNDAINLKLMTSFGSNGSDDDCEGDDECSPELIEFTNVGFEGTSDISCQKGDNTEKFQFCASKEKCSRLLNECVTNEKNIYTGGTISNRQSEEEKEYCDGELLKNCNKKWGLEEDSYGTISELINDLLNNEDSLRPLEAASNNAYGWFNEICISKGFEDKLRHVQSHKMLGNIKGKCLLDPSADPNNCTDGGNVAKDCLCAEAIESFTPTDTITSRKETPREAGLCIDILTPQMCRPIIYEHEGVSSLNVTLGGLIDISHTNRTDDNEGIGHSEFGSVYSSTSARGSCNGFWQLASDNKGNKEIPTMTCDVDGEWNKESFTNNCVRYSCAKISTGGMEYVGVDNEDSRYLGNYVTSNEDADMDNANWGESHGFANWPSYTKTDDYLQTSSAASCIPGYRAKESVLNDSQTAFEGGAFPSRSCNQKGEWRDDVVDMCERLYCPALNPDIFDDLENNFENFPQEIIGFDPDIFINPAIFPQWQQKKILDSALKNIDPGDSDRIQMTQSDYNKWAKSGGATFDAGYASKNKDNIVGAGSKITGECYLNNENERLMFYNKVKADGFTPIEPTRICNYLGIWEDVINPCVTKCSSILDDDNIDEHDTLTPEDNAENNGHSYWRYATNILEGDSENQFGVPETSRGDNGCVPGYVHSPYSPKDHMTIFNDDSSRTTPTKECVSRLRDASDTLRAGRSVWAETIDPCVNYCPGSSEDPRIGIGKTSHPTAEGYNITLDWNNKEFGQRDVLQSSDYLTATHFTRERTENNYIAQRTCGSGGNSRESNAGKWSNVSYFCATAGNFGNASYDAGILEYNVGTLSANSCQLGFKPANYDTGNNSMPQVSCKMEDSTKIDTAYLEVTNDCVEVKCSLAANHIFGIATLPGNLIYDANNDYIGDQLTDEALNSTINLNCGGNYILNNPDSPPTARCNLVDIPSGTTQYEAKFTPEGVIPASTCEEITCSITNNTDFSHNSINYKYTLPDASGMRVGNKVDISCADGFELDEGITTSPQAVCQRNGNVGEMIFDDSAGSTRCIQSVCDEEDITQFIADAGGIYQNPAGINEFDAGTANIVTSCAGGYVNKGGTLGLFCNENGDVVQSISSGSQSAMDCQEIVCDASDISSLEGYTYSDSTDLVAGEEISLTCDSTNNYVAVTGSGATSNIVATCSDGGGAVGSNTPTINSDSATCEKVTCQIDDRELLESGILTYISSTPSESSTFQIGNNIDLSCASGYILNSAGASYPPTARCVNPSDGSSSGSLSISNANNCQEISCTISDIQSFIDTNNLQESSGTSLTDLLTNQSLSPFDCVTGTAKRPDPAGVTSIRCIGSNSFRVTNPCLPLVCINPTQAELDANGLLFSGSVGTASSEAIYTAGDQITSQLSCDTAHYRRISTPSATCQMSGSLAFSNSCRPYICTQGELNSFISSEATIEGSVSDGLLAGESTSSSASSLSCTSSLRTRNGNQPSLSCASSSSFTIGNACEATDCNIVQNRRFDSDQIKYSGATRGLFSSETANLSCNNSLDLYDDTTNLSTATCQTGGTFNISNNCVDCTEPSISVSIDGDSSDIIATYSHPDLNIGDNADNTFNSLGSCTDYQRTARFNIDNVDNIASFILKEVRYDDYLKITLNGTVIFNDFSVFQANGCERGQNSIDYPNEDAKGYLVSGTNTITYDLKVQGGGEVWSRFEFINSQWNSACGSLVQ